MLEFSAEQLARLEALEKRQYVAEVHQAIITAHPELANDAALPQRLEAAYRHAVALGFADGAAVTRFLHYEAVAPGFHREPAINAWLTRPGQPVEQRFADLLDQAGSALKAR